MQKNLIFYILIISLACHLSTSQSDECFPRLVRLLIGDKYANNSSPYTATLMYQTNSKCLKSGIVFKGKNFETSTVSTIHSDWNDTFCHNKKMCENVIYNQYIHTVKVAVDPQTSFTYAFCADSAQKEGCTEFYTSKMPILSNNDNLGFRTNFLSQLATTKKQATPLKIIFFGDNDLSDAGKITINAIYKIQERENFDAFIFCGDYGYEFYQNNGTVGDDYINALTKINTAAPMAITAGNHEDNFNFEFFNQKFQMPFFTENQNNYYSFNIGNTHFLSLNLHYFNDQVNTPNPENQKNMLKWVEQDLKSVDRSVTPWVIVFGHKMIYCKGSDCQDFAKDYTQFDTILNKYNVDLFISGHKHKFLVMKPMNNGEPANYQISKNNIISQYEGFLTVIEGNGGTSKMDDDTLPDILNTQTENNSVSNSGDFDKKKQKEALLEEITNIGFGVLEIQDDNNILIHSIDSKTLESVYDIGLKK
ncbi:hypothetical protein ABPG72_019493 [Tetrahymena utriculariae]